MAIEEGKKREVIQNITTLLRQTKLAGNVDMQRLGMAFSMVLDNVDPGQPIDLQSLYEWLTKEAKVDERAVVEVCVVLKSREQRLGVELVLPAKLQTLSADVVEKILDKFQAGASKSQTYDRKDQPPQKTPGAPTGAAFAPVKTAKKAGTDKKMLLVFAGALVVLVAFYGYYLGTKEPPLQDVTVTDSAGLTCTSLKTNGKVAICEIPPEVWQREGDALKKRAEVTKNELKHSRGVETLYVLTSDNKKARIRL